MYDWLDYDAHVLDGALSGSADSEHLFKVLRQADAKITKTGAGTYRFDATTQSEEPLASYTTRLVGDITLNAFLPAPPLVRWPVGLGQRIQGVVGARPAGAFGHERAHDTLAGEAEPFQHPLHAGVAHRRAGLHACRSRLLEQPPGQQRDRLHAIPPAPVGRVVHDDAKLEHARRQALRWATARLNLADQTAVHLDREVQMAPDQPS
jgi:hypothetical protein